MTATLAPSAPSPIGADAVRPPARLTSLSALVVDDDPFMLAVMAEQLRALGVGEVVAAHGGPEGCAAFDRRPVKPDVVLCDLQMPGTDGFQLMELLAERRFKGGVVVVSGTDGRTMRSASLMARFHRLNFLASISKPIDPDVLRQALTRLA